MAFVRNPVVYVPDLTNGRPIVDGKVYLLTAGTVPPTQDSAINPGDLLTVTYVNEAGNTVTQPQPLYTSKGGCLYGSFPEEARQYMIAPQEYVFAAYDKIGRLQYSAETTASDYVETDALAAANSTVLVGGVEAGDLAASIRTLNSIPVSEFSTGQFMSKVESGNGGTILVVSDSTGNETTEWVYRLAQRLSADNASLTVNYYLWDVNNNVYSAAVVFGSGSTVVNLYNAAVSGSRPDYFYGSRFATMVAGISALDLLIINHGHNLITQSSDADTLRKRTPQLLEMPAMLLRRFDGFGLIFVAQNPRRDDNNYEPIYRAIVDSSGLIGADLVDVYSEFIALGKPANLYNDNIHPNFDGQTIFLEKIYKYFQQSTHKVAKQFIQSGGQNLLPNGDFILYGASGPIGFTLTGVTAEKETVIKETGDYSIKLTSSSFGGLTNILADIPSPKDYVGSVLTLAVRIFIPETNSDSNSGRVGLLTNANSANNTAGGSGKGGWHWRFISVPVVESDIYLRAIVYVGSANTAGSVIYIDRMVLCKGRLPYDNFTKTQAFDPLYLKFTSSGSSIDVTGKEIAEIASEYSGNLTDLTGGVVGQLVKIIPRGSGVSVPTTGNIRHNQLDRTIKLTANTVYPALYDGLVWRIMDGQQIAGCEFVGDASVSFTVGLNAEYQVYDTPLSTGRSITLNGAGGRAGNVFRVVRTANSTGSTLTNSATGKTIAAGTWCEFLYTGSVWIVSASGSL